LKILRYKSFKLFESYEEIKSICQWYGIKNWEINPETGLVDISGDVKLSGRGLEKLPLKFGIVDGNFHCSSNQLTSLENTPNWVNESFYCYDNHLTSLVGAPKSVGSNFVCYGNQLTSLEGSPQSVGGSFWCHDNQIRDFKVPYGSLNESKGFYCKGNPIQEIYQLFNHPKCIDIINEWGIFDGKKIVRIRLEEVFLDMGMEIPEDLRFQKWELV